MLLAVSLMLNALLAASPPEARGDWERMAETDLRFIHDTIAAHHPGPLDDENPAFRAWHEKGFEESVALLDQVKSYGGYRAVVSRYAAGFRDGHLEVDLHLDYLNVGWPRFMLAWRDGGFRVHHVEDGLSAPAVGAVLVECDGRTAATLFAERVLRFAGNGIPADRYHLAPEILMDRVNPLLDDPVRCVFDQAGERVSVDLDWEWRRWASLEELRLRATNGPRGTFQTRELPGNGVWISLPTFGPEGEQLERMKGIMAALPRHRDRDYVVLDVRRNGGGSSYWGEAFVRGLYGDGYFESTVDHDASYAVHRVSRENVEHFEDLDEYLKSHAGQDSEFYRYFAALVVGMKQTLAEGQELYAHRYVQKKTTRAPARRAAAPVERVEGPARQPERPAERAREPAGRVEQPAQQAEPAQSSGPLYRGTVYYLTDATCASACLDIADEMLELPGVVHVGQPTSADTVYGEVRDVRLPSRNGRLSFATKVYRGRKRGHNQHYSPAHEWTGDIWDTPALERWILTLEQSR